jgi:hypothetical protein
MVASARCPNLDREDTMSTITEFTIATAVVAFLLGVAFQINHAPLGTLNAASFAWGDRFLSFGGTPLPPPLQAFTRVR